MKEAPEADLAFARDLVARARAAGADAAQATVTFNARVEVDFQTRKLTLLRTTSDDNAALTVFKRGRKGVAALTGRSPDAIAAALGAAHAAADAAPDDPANGVAEGRPSAPTAYGPAAPDRDLLIDRALAHIETMAREFPEIVTREAYHQFNRTRWSFANSSGVERQETRGCYSFTTMFAARRHGRSTSLNYSGASAFAPFERLIDAAALRRLYGDTVRSFDPRPAPGKFVGDVIIAPDALEGMLVAPLVRVLGGYSLLAGTSPYKDKIGADVASPSFSLVNVPAQLPGGRDFDSYGVPSRDLDVIRDGALRNFLIDFYIARKLGRAQTAGTAAYAVLPGTKPESEIIAETGRGILLTRFSGGAPADNLDFSGIAKNAFYVEDGRMRHPLTETMISGNLGALLLAIRAVSAETVDFGSIRLPTVAAGGVTIHGR